VSLQSFITAVSDLSITGVTTNYDSNEIPESLPDSALPAMLPYLPVAPPIGGQQPVVFRRSGDTAFNAQYYVEFRVYIRPVGDSPPKTYVRDMVTTMDNFLTSIRTNDASFPFEITVRAPTAGVANFAGIDYVMVSLPVDYEELF